MAQPLTREQFEKAQQSGFSTEQIIEFEKKRLGSTTQPIQPQLETIPEKPLNFLQTYLKEAQPALKLAVTHPETFAGKTLTPEEIQRSTNLPWSDIYRQAGGGVLPFAKSQKTAGQLVPQVAGGLLDIGTRPSSYIGSYILPKALKGSALFPPTRRWLQIHTPTLSKWLLESTPVAPQYKEIRGMKVDITKPLSKQPEWLTKQAERLVNSIDETVENARGQYRTLLTPNWDKPFEGTYILPQETITKQLQNYGIDLKNVNTVGDAWEARWALRKLITDPWKKAELFRNTTLKETEIIDLMVKLKMGVLNSLDKITKQQILDLDPNFEDIIQAGKGIKSALFNPETEKYNTVRLVNIFKNVDDSGTRDLFNRFAYFDKRINDVSKAVKGYVFRQGVKRLGKKVVGGGLLLGAGYGLGRRLIGQEQR